MQALVRIQLASSLHISLARLLGRRDTRVQLQGHCRATLQKVSVEENVKYFRILFSRFTGARVKEINDEKPCDFTLFPDCSLAWHSANGNSQMCKQEPSRPWLSPVVISQTRNWVACWVELCMKV